MNKLTWLGSGSGTVYSSRFPGANVVASRCAKSPEVFVQQRCKINLAYIIVKLTTGIDVGIYYIHNSW